MKHDAPAPMVRMDTPSAECEPVFAIATLQADALRDATPGTVDLLAKDIAEQSLIKRTCSDNQRIRKALADIFDQANLAHSAKRYFGLVSDQSRKNIPRSTRQRGPFRHGCFANFSSISFRKGPNS